MGWLPTRKLIRTLDDRTREIVERITKEVIETLKPHSASSAPRATVRPPAGVCTGDYAKFPELAGRLHGGAEGASQPGNVASATTPPPVAKPIALTGIITANQLQQAWDTSPDGTAILALDARLTPLANDLARQYPQKLTRDSNESPTGGSPQASAAQRDAILPWFSWIGGPCTVAEDLVAQRAPRLQRAAAGHDPLALRRVVQDLAAALKGRQVIGGILFVRNAARTACYANRCTLIRAIVGTCGEAVEQGIKELGANVLVIETPHVGPREMQVMVDRMIQQPPAAPPQTLRDLANLHRGG